MPRGGRGRPKQKLPATEEESTSAGDAAQAQESSSLAALSVAHQRALKEAFDILDADGTGALDPTVLQAALHVLDEEPTPEALRGLLADVAGASNGTIGYEEFLQWVTPRLQGRDPEEEEEAVPMLLALAARTIGPLGLQALARDAQVLGARVEAAEAAATSLPASDSEGSRDRLLAALYDEEGLPCRASKKTLAKRARLRRRREDAAHPTTQAASASSAGPPVEDARREALRRAQAPWYYRTPAGEEQGPFRVQHMRAWHIAGYFPRDLPVRMEWYMSFYPLHVLFPDNFPVAFEDLPTHPEAETVPRAVRDWCGDARRAEEAIMARHLASLGLAAPLGDMPSSAAPSSYWSRPWEADGDTAIIDLLGTQDVRDGDHATLEALYWGHDGW